MFSNMENQKNMPAKAGTQQQKVTNQTDLLNVNY